MFLVTFIFILQLYLSASVVYITKSNIVIKIECLTKVTGPYCLRGESGQYCLKLFEIMLQKLLPLS